MNLAQPLAAAKNIPTTKPDKADQANMTVSEALSEWPNLLQSGLRLGSPATSDGGLSWLYDFIDRADALKYRVVAFNSIGASDYSNIATTTTQSGLGVLSQEEWKLFYMDSEEKVGEDGAAANAFDGNVNTINIRPLSKLSQSL